MRLRDGQWECSLCGKALEVPSDVLPLVVIITATGRRRERALMVHGEEVHRCEVDPDRSTPAQW